MTGFELENGDLKIVGNEISMIHGTALTVQTIQSVLSTNNGEWIFDADEGIDFNVIFDKRRVKTKNAKDFASNKEYVLMQENENELAEKLARRLDGE